jgi:hypothetical protein
MSDTDIHKFQHDSFPKMKKPLNNESHPDFHNHKSMTAEVPSSTEGTEPTKTGTAKKPKFPFQGKNS